MENPLEDDVAMAWTRVPTSREWTADDLVRLQESSKIIGIPLSSLIFFAETCYEKANPQVPKAALYTPKELTGDELVTLQQAAQLMSTTPSHLLSFAKSAIQQISFHSLHSSKVQDAGFPGHGPSLLDTNSIISQEVGFAGRVGDSGLALGSEALAFDMQHPLYAVDDPFPMSDVIPYMPDSLHASGSNMAVSSNYFPAVPMNETAWHGSSLPPFSNPAPLELYSGSTTDIDHTTSFVRPLDYFLLGASEAPEIDDHTTNSGAGQGSGFPSHMDFGTVPDPVVASQNAVQDLVSIPQTSQETQRSPIGGTRSHDQGRLIVPSYSSRRAEKMPLRLNGPGRPTGVSKATAIVQGTINSRGRKNVSVRPSLVPCIRCSTSDKKCELFEGSNECIQCQSQTYSLASLPCLYFQITDILLFRTTTDPTSQKAYTVLTLDCNIADAVYSVLRIESCPIINFQITQGSGTVLQLSACRFDSTSIKETSSPRVKALYTHTYALADLDHAKIQIRDFILRSVVPYIKANVTSRDRITSTIFTAVCHRVRLKLAHHGFLSDVLCLWTAARTIEGGWHFVDPQPLGLNSVNGDTVRLRTAPFLDYQVSAILVQDILLPLRERVLGQLNKLTTSNTSENWFTLFLANFVLLHSYSLLIKQQRAFARQRNSPYRYNMMSLIKGIHLGARTLLAYFHNICKGQRLFEVDWIQEKSTKTIQGIAQLSHDEIDLLITLSTEVRGRVSQLEDLMHTDEYESDLWFTGQLFIPDWRPPKTIEDPQISR